MSERSNPQNNHDSSHTDPIYPGSGPPSSYPTPPAHRRAPSLFWPIALIGFGVLLLLSNLGLIPATGWAVLWRLWPIALIALGLDVLVGRRSVAGAIASGVLVLLLVGFAIAIALFAEQIPALVDLARAPVMQIEHIEYPLEDIASSEVTIDFATLPGYLSALQDSGNLIEGDVAYRGELLFNIDRVDSRAVVNLDTIEAGILYGPAPAGRERAVWDIKLAADHPIDLTLDAGSGSGDYDLTDLTITNFKLDAGSGRITLTLPQNSTFDGTIDGSSGALTIIVPSDVGLRLTLDDGSGGFYPGEQLRLVSGDAKGDGIWESEAYNDAAVQIALYLDQGSGSITIQ